MCRASIISLRYKPSQLESATLLLAVGLSPNKSNEKPCPFGIRCAASRASSNPLRFFSLLGCRIIRIMKSHAHSESAALQAEPARIRYAPSHCWGCRPIRIKRKDDSLVNKFPILSSFLFILTRLVAYPKYRSNNPFNALP